MVGDISVTDDFLQKLATKYNVDLEVLYDAIFSKIVGRIRHVAIFEGAAKANTPIFDVGDFIMPKLPSSLLRIQVQIDGAYKMRVDTRISGGTWRTSKVLDDAAFVAEVTQSFDFQVQYGQIYNIEFTGDCNIRHLIIDEVPVDS